MNDAGAEGVDAIAGRLEKIRSRIEAAALRVGRDPREVALLGVSKRTGESPIDAHCGHAGLDSEFCGKAAERVRPAALASAASYTGTGAEIDDQAAGDDQDQRCHRPPSPQRRS